MIVDAIARVRCRRPLPACVSLLMVAAAALAACSEEPAEVAGPNTVVCGADERRVVDSNGQTICEPVAVTPLPDVTGDDTGGEDTAQPDTDEGDDTAQADTGGDDTSVTDTTTDDTGDDRDMGAGDTADAQPGDTGDDTAQDTDDDVDAMVPGEFRRFVAIGDVGEGSAEQYHVAASIGMVCGTLGGCDFGVLLGDNFYDSGVDGDMDPMFDTHFAQPYGPLGFPFYVVLGNHDLGGDGLGIDLDFQKGDYQVSYSQTNPQWKMPAKHYQFEEGPLWFAALNTTDIFFDQDNDQYAAVTSWLAQYDTAGDTRWKIAFGHHPYLSNGKHGNAGNYEGIPDAGGWSDIPRGQHVKDFFEDNICNNFDLYLAGHDHSRQDLVASCGVELIVSGAGAKTTEVDGDNPNHFEADTTGFVIIDATEETLVVQFYDRDGALEHSRTITR